MNENINIKFILRQLIEVAPINSTKLRLSLVVLPKVGLCFIVLSFVTLFLAIK